MQASARLLRWARASALTRPLDTDLADPVPAIAPSGAFAVGSATTNIDAPAQSSAEIVTGRATGRRAATFGAPVALAGAGVGPMQQVLAATYLRARLLLLVGASPASANLACCSAAGVMVGPAPGTASAPALTGPVTSALTGATTGALVPYGHGLIALVDGVDGVWTAQVTGAGAISSVQQWESGGLQPPVAAAAPLAAGGAIFAYTSAPAASVAYSGEQIDYVVSGAQALSAQVRVAATVPAGLQVDSISVAQHGRGATIAVTESWFDASDTLHSQVAVADVGSGPESVRLLSPSSALATDVTLAGSPGGTVVAWQSCAPLTGACVAEAALRRAGRGWGTARALGAIDPEEFPAAAESASGEGVVTWISGGDVRAAAAAPGAPAFGKVATLSRDGQATAPAVTFGGGSRALATWIDGTVDERLVAAVGAVS